MKKILNIALTAALALAWTACDDVDVDYGIPSTNPQEGIMPANGVQATDVIATGGLVDLDALKTDGYVTMLNITKAENLPADQTLKVVMNVASKEDMSDAKKIELTVAPSDAPGVLFTASAPALAWDEVFKSLVSRDPSAKMMYVDYVAYAERGSSEVLLGSIGTKQAVSVKPFGYDHEVETVYYVYGTINDGSIATAVKLSHDGNQYDNPEFKVKIDITSEDIASAGGWKFKVIPQSTFATGKDWAQNKNGVYIGAGSEEGTLAYATAEKDAEWVVLTKPGSYMLNINIFDQTYTLTNAIEYLYMPGDGNGWTWSTKLFTDNYINYKGFANLANQFKITGTAGWNTDLGNYGAGDNNYTLVNGSNDNFKIDGPNGLYWVEVDFSSMTYKKTQIKTIGLVGSHNNWSAPTATAMTPSEDNLIWEGTLTLTDADEFKFCMNGGWDINLGGAEDDLTIGGGNLKPGAGTYLVTLDLSALPYQCYIEEQ